MKMKTKKSTSSSALPYILAKPGLISSEQKELCSSKVGSWNAGGQSAGDTDTHLQETVRGYPSVHSNGFYNLFDRYSQAIYVDSQTREQEIRFDTGNNCHTYYYYVEASAFRVWFIQKENTSLNPWN